MWSHIQIFGGDLATNLWLHIDDIQVRGSGCDASCFHQDAGAAGAPEDNPGGTLSILVSGTLGG